MLKKYKKTLIITSVISLLPILAGVALWDKLPQQIATHFGVDNTPDGYSSKTFAVFGLPLIILAIHWLCIFATSFDPKSKNISGKAINIAFWICPLTSLLLNSLTYAYALGNEIEIGFVVILFMGILFIVLGNYLPKCKQNHTFGIRLPWTLNDSENWNKTHRLAGKVFVIGGILICLTAITQNPFVFFAIIAVMVVVPTVCSYFLSKKDV